MTTKFKIGDKVKVNKVLNNIQKQMTKKQAFEYLNNKKFKVKNIEQVKQITEKLKSLDVEVGDLMAFLYGINTIHSGSLRLFNLYHITDYNICDNEEITPQDILSIELVEEQEPIEKFDFNTLKPFQKVLVRDNNGDDWGCDFFSHIIENAVLPFKCVSTGWMQCIPYNEETMHLVGTCDKAPEKYRQ